MQLDRKNLNQIIKNALEEDIGSGDITTETIIPESRNIKAEFVAREEAITCGIPILEEVFSFSDKTLGLFPNSFEGSLIKKDDRILTVSGDAKEI